MPRLFLVLAVAAVLVGSTARPVQSASPRPEPDAPQVDVPRLLEEIAIDGILDEAVWSQAVVLGSFTQYLPVDGRPAQDSTEILVWYSQTHIYFGIRAYETHGEVRATLADRDRLANEDYVTLVLDTFDAQREAIALSVNPFGVQADGILRDAVQSAVSHNASAGSSGNFSLDLSPDFVFESRGRLTSYGFEVEIAVPFKSLRYQSDFTQDWGLNVIRKVQHSGFVDTWRPVRQASASFLAQSGRLVGLTDLRRGIVLDINPEVMRSTSGAPDADGWRYDTDDRYGGNVRWGITNNLVLNGTVNPDFSQVEADVAQIQTDPRRAVYFPEKRPFFLDGNENFQAPNQLIYTRQIASPEAAVKVSGKTGGFTLGLISALDDRRTSLSGDDLRGINALRVRRDLRGQSTLGLVYTDQVDGDTWNRVAAVDGRIVFRDLYSFAWQTAASFTHDGNRTRSAPMWSANFSVLGQRYGLVASAVGIHPDFVTRAGFISRGDIVRINIEPRYTHYGSSGAFVERFIGSFNLLGRWDYGRFTAGTGPNDRSLFVNGQFGLRGGWSVSWQAMYESFKYPAYLYENYFVEVQNDFGVPVDTLAYSGTDRFTNKDLSLNISTPRYSTFSGGLYVIFGRDENFFEWAPADILLLVLSANWSPTDQIRVSANYQHQQYFRYDDKSVVGLRRVPRLKIEYQLTRDLFVRLVSQYDSYFRDELRDNSRTDDPILIRDPGTGAYRRTSEIRTNRLRWDWLVSYRPTPGTVVFVGYGSTLDEPDTFRLRRMRRLNDGFFVKLSYLFRV